MRTQDRRGLRRRLRALRLPGDADLADGGLRARRQDRRTRWRCTCPTTARCRCRSRASRRSRFPAGLAEPDGGGPELPVGLQIAAPAFGENRGSWTPRTRSSAGSGSTRRRAGCRSMSAPDGYEAVIGLEIHVQLAPGRRCSAAARSRSATSPTSTRARSASPIPGACRSSTSRRSATRFRSALALGCEIAPRSIFHRKNYFYPDNPKGYQISQYDIPLASAGTARRGPHPPRPPRGGRGEDDPRRRVGPHPRLGVLAGRLQPRRHAAGGDRHRARPPRLRRGAGVGAAAADDGQAARRLRREHGGGEPAMRRQRLDPAGWAAKSSERRRS